ncbi:maltose permease [Pyrenophora seminiperda CCB06]|uniref:Maltose permease n=1 Tax=Pyrenophora seminiperda CCB06 TaxID=1302712 RepID=A0A3M7MCX1_9PLEO|nr:maltose permease [Pyrenophora seminiperda CCB06]
MRINYLLATLATTAPGVFGRNCDKGLTYCGSTLLDIGDYSSQIYEALQAYGCESPSASNYVNTLFFCVGGSDGDIIVKEICKLCHDEGGGNNDRCLVSGGTCGDTLH